MDDYKGCGCGDGDMSETREQKVDRIINKLMGEGFDVDEFMKSLEEVGRAWADAYDVNYDSLDRKVTEE